jgi:hypothetical protein
VSGGVDSSYIAYVAKNELGLRPLAMHVDNGWNSELAVQNIEQIVKKLGIDLVTHVIEWPQFRAAQLSLVRASVVDIELVSDHAILAGLFATARHHRIPTIVTGDSFLTEATLPKTWNHRKTDLRNLRAIHRRFGGGVPIDTIPQLGTLGMWLHQRLLGIRIVGLLSYVPYVKADAIATLERELGWRAYGGKHYESIITRFYQGYILPKKFGIDKRRLHFSRLVCSGQMTREAALRQLETDPYDRELRDSDREFVLKKLGLSDAEFDRILAEEPRSHHDYPSDEALLATYGRVKRGLTRLLRRDAHDQKTGPQTRVPRERPPRTTTAPATAPED